MAWTYHNHLFFMVLACMLVIALARPFSSGNHASENRRTKEQVTLKHDDDDDADGGGGDGRILENNAMDYRSGPNPRHGRNSKWGGGGGKMASGSP